jgi:tetratricopeptide (TPR) repeat protein
MVLREKDSFRFIICVQLLPKEPLAAHRNFQSLWSNSLLRSASGPKPLSGELVVMFSAYHGSTHQTWNGSCTNDRLLSKTMRTPLDDCAGHRALKRLLLTAIPAFGLLCIVVVEIAKLRYWPEIAVESAKPCASLPFSYGDEIDAPRNSDFDIPLRTNYTVSDIILWRAELTQTNSSDYKRVGRICASLCANLFSMAYPNENLFGKPRNKTRTDYLKSAISYGERAEAALLHCASSNEDLERNYAVLADCYAYLPNKKMVLDVYRRRATNLSKAEFIDTSKRVMLITEYGTMLCRAGQFSAAEKAFLNAVEIVRISVGELDGFISSEQRNSFVTAYRGITQLLVAQGRTSEAIDYQNELLTEMKSRFGSRSSEVRNQKALNCRLQRVLKCSSMPDSRRLSSRDHVFAEAVQLQPAVELDAELKAEPVVNLPHDWDPAMASSSCDFPRQTNATSKNVVSLKKQLLRTKATEYKRIGLVCKAISSNLFDMAYSSDGLLIHSRSKAQTDHLLSAISYGEKAEQALIRCKSCARELDENYETLAYCYHLLPNIEMECNVRARREFNSMKKRAIPVRERIRALGMYGYTLSHIGHLRQAEQIFLTGVQISRTSKDAFVENIYNGMIDCLIGQGKISEALVYQEEVLDRIRLSYPRDWLERDDFQVRREADLKERLLLPQS